MTKHTHRRCFFDVTVDGKLIGRIVFELFDDLCPKTTENFRLLCTGDRGKGVETGKLLHYKGSLFHRVVKGFMVQGGDFSAGNGTGGESIYGGTFDDENLSLRHDRPFLLSMANRGPDTNGSQFFVTTKIAPHLDGIHVIIGKVVVGQDVVLEIEQQKVDSKSRPVADVVINDCGELVLKQSKKRKKKHRHSSSSSSSSSHHSGQVQLPGPDTIPHNVENETKPEENLSTIKATGVPKDPDGQHNFLMRKSKSPTEQQVQITDRERRQRNRRVIYSRSGHRIRGRGALRYRTPSASDSNDSRSNTPPHWRREEARLMVLAEKTDNLEDDKHEQHEQHRPRRGSSRDGDRLRMTGDSRDDPRRNRRPTRRSRSRSRGRGRRFRKSPQRRERRRFREEKPRKAESREKGKKAEVDKEINEKTEDLMVEIIESAEAVEAVSEATVPVTEMAA